jgi:pimeloyl-ACP methyl ester carboxylesterase
MSLMLLLHGAWHGSWCWEPLSLLLEAAGHGVLAPSLPGMGEHAAQMTCTTGLHEHLHFLQELLESQSQAVILCAHSYGGMLARGLCSSHPEHIRAVLYLDAYVPDDGQCGLDLRPPGSNDSLLSTLQEGWRLPAPPAARFDVPAGALRDWVDRRLTAMPLACFQERLRLVEPSLELPPASYLRTAWSNASLDGYYQRFLQLGRPAERWTCGHDAMLEHPQAVAQLLLALDAAAQAPQP